MLKAEVKIRYSLVDNKVITLQQGAYLTTSKLFNSWHSHSQPYVKLDLKDNFPTTQPALVIKISQIPHFDATILKFAEISSEKYVKKTRLPPIQLCIEKQPF